MEVHTNQGGMGSVPGVSLREREVARKEKTNSVDA